MNWIQFATLFITFVGLFIWNRTERRADIRHIDAKLVQINKENRELINRQENRVLSIIASIQQEIKNFHGRLCSIEERNKK